MRWRCKKCGCKPIVKSSDGLHYAQCSNKKCNKWHQHQFCGLSVDKTLDTLDMFNNPNKAKEYEL